MLSFRFNPFTSNFDTISVVTAGTVGSTPNTSGLSIDSVAQVLVLQPANSTNPGVLTALAQSIGGVKTFTSAIIAPGIDTTLTGGTDTLNIGTTNADIINIGNSGTAINLYGTTFYQNVTNLQVTDKLITINKGGGSASGFGAGLEIEENGLITGYVSTSTDRNSWELKAPNTAGIAVITPGVSGITLNQSSHDPVSLTAVGSTPNAGGASISGQALTLQPANGTNPGVITAGAQSIGGTKTFTGSVNIDGTTRLATALTGPLKASSGTVSASAISLTTEVTGILPVANGGTGANTLTANNVILGNGTSAVQFVAPGTSGNVLTSNGTTWVSSAPATGTSSARNMIINGNMDFWQRGTSFTINDNVTRFFYSADMISYSSQGPTVKNYSVNQVTSVPTVAQSGFVSQFSHEFLVNGATAFAAADLVVPFRYRMEGFDYSEIHAQAITVGFWAYATATGSYSVAFLNSAKNRSYVTDITINTTNTWEFKTVTLTLDSAGTWLFNNGIGLEMTIGAAAGTTYQTGTINSWIAGEFYASNTATNIFGNANNRLRITQSSLVKGSTGLGATGFRRTGDSIADEMDLAQRYFEKSYVVDVAPATVTMVNAWGYRSVFNATSNNSTSTVVFKTRKRNTPTVTVYNPVTGATGSSYDNDATTSRSTTAINTGDSTFRSVVSITVTGNDITMHWTADASL